MKFSFFTNTQIKAKLGNDDVDTFKQRLFAVSSILIFCWGNDKIAMKTKYTISQIFNISPVYVIMRMTAIVFNATRIVTVGL